MSSLILVASMIVNTRSKVSIEFISLPNRNVTYVRIEIDDVHRRRAGLKRALKRRVHHCAAIHIEMLTNPDGREESGNRSRGHDHQWSKLFIGYVFVFERLHFTRLPICCYNSQLPV